jgi:hypothetical protein
MKITRMLVPAALLLSSNVVGQAIPQTSPFACDRSALTAAERKRRSTSMVAPCAGWSRESANSAMAIAELDSQIERVSRTRELLQRRCECVDLDECGRKMVEAKDRRTMTRTAG